MKTETTNKTPTFCKRTSASDRYIQAVFDTNLEGNQNEADKFLVGQTLVSLGLATLDEEYSGQTWNVTNFYCRFKSTKTLQLLIDLNGLFIPFPAKG